MKILFTGFEPFGGESENPSSEVLDLIPNTLETTEIHKSILPVSFTRCIDAVDEFLMSATADCIIALGQAGGRADISIERIAVNLMNARKPDCDGFLPHGSEIINDAPAAYISSSPVDELCDVVKEAGIPCHVSNHAGLFVCNTLYYQLLHKYPEIPSCFIHLPYTLRQAVGKSATTPSMSTSVMADAIKAILLNLSQNG